MPKHKLDPTWEAQERERLKILMNDPRYWKHSDPEIVAEVRDGFTRLTDNPPPEALAAEAGQAANMAGENGPMHAQDSEIAHVTPGEIVIPKSAQTPEVLQALYGVMGEELMTYMVGSGAAKRNPVSGLEAFADSVVTQPFSAARRMWENFDDMREANTKGADKYYHCKANFEASEHGDVAETTAKLISDGREVYGLIKGDSVDDMVRDQLANKHGRNASKSGKYRTAEEACAKFKPKGLHKKHW